MILVIPRSELFKEGGLKSNVIKFCYKLEMIIITCFRSLDWVMSEGNGHYIPFYGKSCKVTGCSNSSKSG